MKKFLIIYVYKEARFHIQFEAAGIHTALDKFESEQKLNVECIQSIDIL